MTQQLPAPAPWEQQDREPNRAFEHFLYYLYSPRPRSMLKACKAMNPSTDKVSEVWKREAKIWQWDERAHAFDVEQITRHGQEVVVNMVDAMRLLSRRLLESLATDRGEVWTYDQTITAFRLLSELVPAETVATLRTTAGSGDAPAIGSRPGVAVNTIVADFSAIAPGSVGDCVTPGEAESGVQRAPVGKDDDGRFVGSGSSITGGESVVDSAHV